MKLPSQVTNKLGLGPAAAKDSDKQAQLQANTMIRPSYYCTVACNTVQ